MGVGDAIWNPTQQSDYETQSTLPRNKWVAAFTVAELGEMLPSYAQTHRIAGTPTIWMGGDVIDEDEYKDERGSTIRGDTEANTRAKMVIYLVENGLLLKSA